MNDKLNIDSLKGQKILNKYLVEEIIGSGGYATVLRCYEILSERRVAIKRILIDKTSPFKIEDCINEVKNLAKFENSLNIIRLYSYEQKEEIFYIITEYARDGNLRDLLKAKGKIDIKTSLDLIMQLLNGLKGIHGKNIIHGDIKPKNILISEGIVKISDFGISTDIERIKPRVFVGSNPYMAPEYSAGEKISFNSDIYSVGVILYELLTGELPKKTDSGLYLSNIYSEKLKSIIEISLKENSSLRYENAEEMLNDLKKVIDSQKDEVKDDNNIYEIIDNEATPKDSGKIKKWISREEEKETPKVIEKKEFFKEESEIPLIFKKEKPLKKNNLKLLNNLLYLFIILSIIFIAYKYGGKEISAVKDFIVKGYKASTTSPEGKDFLKTIKNDVEKISK